MGKVTWKDAVVIQIWRIVHANISHPTGFDAGSVKRWDQCSLHSNRIKACDSSKRHNKVEVMVWLSLYSKKDRASLLWEGSHYVVRKPRLLYAERPHGEIQMERKLRLPAPSQHQPPNVPVNVPSDDFIFQPVSVVLCLNSWSTESVGIQKTSCFMEAKFWSNLFLAIDKKWIGDTGRQEGSFMIYFGNRICRICWWNRWRQWRDNDS